MINKDMNFFQYNSGDLVYIFYHLLISCGLHPEKVAIRYVGPLELYKIIDPHNYLLMMLDGNILIGILKHKRSKPVTMRTSQGNVCNLLQLKQIVNTDMKM